MLVYANSYGSHYINHKDLNNPRNNKQINKTFKMRLKKNGSDFADVAVNDNGKYYYRKFDNLQNFFQKLNDNDNSIFQLTKGNNKSLLIAKLSPESKARRVDFLYATPEERPFALLYFTGSKEFNTAMRQIALNQQLTLNEHGFHKINKNKKKTEKITQIFKSEKDIFDYLNMVYKEPHERIDGNFTLSFVNVNAAC